MPQPAARPRGDEHVVTRPEDPRPILALEQEPGGPGEHQHPLGPVLVVP